MLTIIGLNLLLSRNAMHRSCLWILPWRLPFCSQSAFDKDMDRNWSKYLSLCLHSSLLLCYRWVQWKKLFHTFFIPWTNVCIYFLIYVGALLTPIVAKPFLKDSEVESTLIGNGTMFDVTELELENTGFWTIKSLYPLIFMIMVLPVPGFIFYFIQVVFNVI